MFTDPRPPSLPRGNLFPPRKQRNLRLQAGRKQLAMKLANIKSGAAGDGKGGDSGEYGISWGFDEDAVAEEEDEEEGMEGADGEVILCFVLLPWYFVVGNFLFEMTRRWNSVFLVTADYACCPSSLCVL